MCTFLPSLPSCLFLNLVSIVFLFLPFYFPSPALRLLLHLHSLHPYSAQVDRCLAGWPVIITVVLGVSGGWHWLFFEYFTARTGQDRTFPGAMGDWRGNEDTSREDRENKKRKTRVLLFVDFIAFYSRPCCIELFHLGKRN